MSEMLPPRRDSVPPVTIPPQKVLKAAMLKSETMGCLVPAPIVDEAKKAENTAESVAKTVRPAKRGRA